MPAHIPPQDNQESQLWFSEEDQAGCGRGLDRVTPVCQESDRCSPWGRWEMYFNIFNSFQVHLGSRRKLKAVKKMSLTLSTPCLQSCPQLRVNIIINYNNNNSETKDAQTCRWWEDLPSQGAKTKMHEKQLRSPRFSQALNFERLHLQGFCTLRTFFEEVEHFLLSSH